MMSEKMSDFGCRISDVANTSEIRHPKSDIERSGPLTATRENQLCPIREERYAAGRLSP